MISSRAKMRSPLLPWPSHRSAKERAEPGYVGPKKPQLRPPSVSSEVFISDEFTASAIKPVRTSVHDTSKYHIRPSIKLIGFKPVES
jgi:hypothetical protein